MIFVNDLLDMTSKAQSGVPVVVQQQRTCLKKGQTELLCRTDADSQTLRNLWSLEGTVWGVGRCAWVMGWKSCEIGLL